MKNRKEKKNSVRKVLLMGVFWRILFIETVLLVYSLGYSWAFEDTGVMDLFWYALRIMALVGIIIAFMMISLKKFLAEKIIFPLESISRANKEIKADFSGRARVFLPQDTPDEIREIETSRETMLKKIMEVSNERLGLVHFIKETFGRYLSQKVVEEILASPQNRQVGGSRKIITVLMADLRGFTRMSEKRDPEEMVKLLNQYLETMSRIIIKYDGIIDEIIGDAILAVFGALEQQEDDPQRAVACAVEMQNCMLPLNASITQQGYPPLDMGIGINTGTVIVGNIGSEVRMKYGIVGDAVNRAARIESNSIGGQVLIGESTYNPIQALVKTAPPGSVMMKGMKDPLVFYPVLSIDVPEGRIHLDSLERKNAFFDIRLPFQCWIIRGKHLKTTPFYGETLSMDDHRMHVVTDSPLEPLTDVKLRFDFCTQAHCFEDIYAKCVQHGGDLAPSLLQITAMADKDRKMIQTWMDQAAG